ncbi:DNA-directed RNA polymerase I subunit RPA2 isoform X3 [Copidosoma floridanum]|uniref:DNA-directed RNA polymerase I subunit RPA2 isoform X2 n=1 Tax=Copidosoma floridanum TaxID=29053 RepID=UPI000C6F68E9|nr:DNA-directed RNA polymerase I subunit RPA2 isoform X2 [Copidosoma floridanum]XP_023247010.1 DNA-directed RNA polymerase I subunit RPA2 isoform X3 [Copidosoma floridanum]
MLIEPKLTNTSPDFAKPACKQNPLLQVLGKPHVDSFNYMLEEGLSGTIKNLTPVYLTLPSGDKIELKFEHVSISRPAVPSGTIGVSNSKILPTECRQRAVTYKGRINAKIAWSINGRKQETLERCLGEIPIMVKSNRCHLQNLSPAQLIKVKEHEQEWGGYFIIKGYERLIRMLLMIRRNYPIAIKRSTWKQRGKYFSDMGILLRSVTDDCTSMTNTLHYLTDGSVKVMFTYRKQLFHIPLILVLKCLMNASDKFIYNALTADCDHDVYYKNCVLNMLRTIHSDDLNLHTHEQCKLFIGKMFRIKFYELPPTCTDTEVCDFILKQCIAIHLDDPLDKFNLFCFMTKKLFALISGKCIVEGVDSVMMQECLLGGHLYLQVIKEKLYSWLMVLRSNISKRSNNVGNSFTLNTQEMQNMLKYCGTFDSQMENFLSTGNIRSQSGLGLLQHSGLTIVAENINRTRYMSHFRAVHRGSFFQQMRTTEARQLLPDAWGFICPVHTPDGTPCGLLNHLTMNCTITEHPDPKLKNAVPNVLLTLGMLSLSTVDDWKNSYTVHLDGKIIGLIEDNIVDRVVDKLRILKTNEEVPPTMEIVFVPKKNVALQYPGIFLFTNSARMMRPVKNLLVNKTELIGTFEQVYLNICVTAEEAYEGLTTHQELSKTAFLSNLASLTPLSDYNQSPRNMYQCQMVKQTMGTPCLTWQQQTETKAYRLQTPSTPLFRPVHYDHINLDEFPVGTNAIVAVISYTGYDMEDAMIINKAAYERGFAHGMIYKSEFIELKEQGDYFAKDPQNSVIGDKLDSDGLPNPGSIIKFGDPFYCFFDGDQKTFVLKKYSGKEDMFVDNVKLCGTLHQSVNRKACITYRISRNPNVGDKFASRAGQKGICSQKWPAEDLPFTETGLVPDIIFNPHGFPSRMTIGKNEIHFILIR